MTLLRPGMKGHIKLPDGSVFHVEVAKDGVPEHAVPAPSTPKAVKPSKVQKR